MKIIKHRDEDFESLMKRFKKSVQTSGILMECRKREYFRTKNELRIFKQSLRNKKK